MRCCCGTLATAIVRRKMSGKWHLDIFRRSHVNGAGDCPSQTRSQQENIHNIKARGGVRIEQAGGRTQCNNVFVHIDPGVGPYHQMLLNRVAFPCLHLPQHLLYGTLDISVLFVFFSFAICLCYQLFWTLFYGTGHKSSEKFTEQLTQTFAFSHLAPLDSFRKISRVQCKSESSYTLILVWLLNTSWIWEVISACTNT